MAPIFTGFRFGFAASSSFSATGGTTSTPGNGYTYHTFTHPGTPATASYPYPGPQSFVVSGGSKSIDVLVVAGGGGGGSGYYGGGGGGGAVILGQTVSVSSGTYPITVGMGGTGGTYPPGPSGGVNGGNSAFDTVTSLGGGYGGYGPGTPPATQGPGGSGGNAGGGSGYAPGGTSTPMTIPSPYSSLGTWNIYQYPRTVANSPYSAGDGAGGRGYIQPSDGTGVGGIGATITAFPGSVIPTLSPVVPRMGPTSNIYGGGGSSGADPASMPLAGGFGGGGAANNGDATATVDYLGGGGGGSSNPRGNGGKGGSGVVIIRYLV